MPVTPDARRPRGPIWGFHEASRHSRRDVDPILLVDRDPEACRMIAQQLARAGYSVEWTVDPAVAPGWVSARRYALLLSEECPNGIAEADPDLPVLPIREPIDTHVLVALVRARARPRDRAHAPRRETHDP